jgi:hypothetical protein
MSTVTNTLPVHPLGATPPGGATGSSLPPASPASPVAAPSTATATSTTTPTKFNDSRPHDYGYRTAANSRPAPVVAQPAAPSLFVPVLLATLALLGWLVFQTLQLAKEREALQSAFASQQQTVDNAAKLRASLDAVAADTQRLADSGNPNAKLLVDELRKRGITISTTATATVPAVKP